MSRRTFIRSGVFPAVLCALLAAAWARSYRVMDEWSMGTDAGEVRAVCVYQGAVHMMHGGTRAATRPVSYDTHAVPAGATWGNLSGAVSGMRVGVGSRGRPVKLVTKSPPHRSGRPDGRRTGSGQGVYFQSGSGRFTYVVG